MKNERVQTAIEEFKVIIQEEFPATTFAVSPDEDEPEMVHLTATVDVPNPRIVLDLVRDRLLELQIKQELPLHIIPIRPLVRVLADMRERGLIPVQLTS